VEAEPPTDTEGQIFESVNAERKRRGLTPLAWSSELLPAAREHSPRMGSAEFFSHEDPERGLLPKRLKAAGVRYTLAGENLFMLKGVPDVPDAAVRGWLNSSAHREIMLSGGFDRTAVGVYRTESGAVYGTQIFTGQERF
jgi:uncharacterized protein YkwD